MNFADSIFDNIYKEKRNVASYFGRMKINPKKWMKSS